MVIYRNEKELQTACKKWQKIMRLRDWDVKCRITRARDMKLEGVSGECEWAIQSKTAIINILDPVDYPDLSWEHDMEETLVHELMHLHSAPFDTFDSDSSENVALEQMIVTMSQALINLKRKDG